MYTNLIWAIILFGIGAIFGVVMLLSLLKGTTAPNAAVGLHAVNAVALLMVIVAAAGVHNAILSATAVIGVIAALGGIALFYFDKIMKKPVPRALVFIHPLAGIITVILLIATVVTA